MKSSIVHSLEAVDVYIGRRFQADGAVTFANGTPGLVNIRIDPVLAGTTAASSAVSNIAIGNPADAGAGPQNVAIGVTDTSSATGAVSISTAGAGTDSVSVGTDTGAATTSSSGFLALGTRAADLATGNNTLAIGTDAAGKFTTETGNVCIGPTTSNSGATGASDRTVVGSGAYCRGVQGVAIGKTARAARGVGLGTNTLSFATDAQRSTMIGARASCPSNTVGVVSVGADSVSDGGIHIGPENVGTKGGGVAFGGGHTTSHSNNTMLGYGSTAGRFSVAAGVNAKVRIGTNDPLYCTAVGYNARLASAVNNRIVFNASGSTNPLPAQHYVRMHTAADKYIELGLTPVDASAAASITASGKLNVTTTSGTHELQLYEITF